MQLDRRTSSHAMLTAAQVRQLCSGISDMTLWRWLRDEAMSFPKPLFINRRRYWEAAAVELWLSNRQSSQVVGRHNG